VKILLVEDNAGDARLMVEVFQESSTPVQVSIVTDGDQALAFLRREGKYMEAVQPDLILLDLNLPRKDGREVLLELKDDPALRTIPVMILTSSPSREDRRQAATVGVERFLNKPMGLEEYYVLVQEIVMWWKMRQRVSAA
jgi:CheY-like chemotaxis protein